MKNKLEEKLKSLPAKPGVYFHKSKTGEIIYVGKAAVLRNRVRQYFQQSRLRDNKTMALVAEIADTDWIETESEVDALFLESEMIKRYMPRFNVLLRDDKSQMYVRIDMFNEWPVVSFTRNPLDDKAEYIGPFYNGLALKKALRYLRKAFPYLTKHRRPRQSRLDEDLGLSPQSENGSDKYKSDLRKLISYTKGNRKKLVYELEADMKSAAAAQEFEKAAKLRDKLQSIKELQRRIMFGDAEFLDISKDKALSQLTSLFGLKDVPKRIEGFDISHMSGKNVVASMVVFTNGTSERGAYRKFKVSEKNDDAGNIYETVFRRLSERNLTNWGKPDLLLIDGGKPQLLAAIRARNERKCKVPIISIAKREEEIIVSPESMVDLDNTQKIHDNPVEGVYARQENGVWVINLHVGRHNASGHSKNLRGGGIHQGKYEDVLKLFQRIRDESHRFAVSYHTTLKRSEQTVNELETIPGIGPKTRSILLRKFGSFKAIKSADENQLVKIIGKDKTKKLRQYLTNL